MATAYFCVDCNYETEDKDCPHCQAKTEPLNVKDDPLLGALTNDSGYTLGREDQLYL